VQAGKLRVLQNQSRARQKHPGLERKAAKFTRIDAESNFRKVSQRQAAMEQMKRRGRRQSHTRPEQKGDIREMNEYMKEQAEKAAYERLRKIAHPDQDHQDADASALRFNPESLEYEHPSDGPFENPLPERFIIDSDKKADWAIEKIKAERAEFDRLRKIALDRIAELNQRVKELQERTDRRTGNLEALLVEYFQTVTPTKITKTQTQYELLSGKLVMKKQQPLYERDETALLNWAEATVPELIKVKKEVSWADLKKQADVSGDKLLLDGEIIPGVTVVERDDVFEVQA